MMKTNRTETWWTIEHVDYGFLSYYASTKRVAIKDLVDNFFKKYTWAELKKLGYRAVKVSVKEIE